MWLLIKTAWRNLFRQRRRTLITVSAMALSLWLAIPTWGLTEGLTQEMLKGITRMELGHIQLHDPGYPASKALQATIRRPDRVLQTLRSTPGVKAAAARVHGYALASHDTKLTVTLRGLPAGSPALTQKAVLFGRAIDPQAPWRTDVALACEAVLSREAARKHGIVVGTVMTPSAARGGGHCERVRVVGLLRHPVPGGASSQGAVLALLAGDMQQAFGKPTVKTAAVLRHSAAVQIVGVDPPHERRVSFMADKVVKGTYLPNQPNGGIVVGWRLARTMRLKVGSPMFMQAAALDQTKGTFSRQFKVVGIYRTGVEMLDRSRVFLHLRDAQRLMALGRRVHEIVVNGPDARDPFPLARRIRKRVKTRLRIATKPTGLRAGSAPLPAPVTVYEPTKSGDAALVTPYDLKQRFVDSLGVRSVGKRIYGRVRLATASQVSVQVATSAWADLQALGAKGPADRCTLYVPAAVASALKLKPGQTLVPAAAALGGEDGCAAVKVVGLRTAPAPKPAGSRAPPRPSNTAYAVAPAAGGDDDDELAALEAGPLTLYRVGASKDLRMVGVEAESERKYSHIDRRVTSGKDLYEALKSRPTSEGRPWPALVPQRVAKARGWTVGTVALARARDLEKHEHYRAVQIVGLLEDAHWPAKRPQIVLPFFQAQQVDAPRLNARGQELLLDMDPRYDQALAIALARANLNPLVQTWQQVQPDMAKLLQAQDFWVGIMLFIIFALAALTVMNTMLMAVWERTREFGVLKSIGMRPGQVFALIVFETFFLAVFAVIVGGGGGLALNQLAVVYGIDLSTITGGFTYQGTFISPIWRAAITLKVAVVPMVMVQAVCLLVSFYPALRAGRLKPVVALRHNG